MVNQLSGTPEIYWKVFPKKPTTKNMKRNVTWSRGSFGNTYNESYKFFEWLAKTLNKFYAKWNLYSSFKYSNDWIQDFDKCIFMWKCPGSDTQQKLHCIFYAFSLKMDSKYRLQNTQIITSVEEKFGEYVIRSFHLHQSGWFDKKK